MKKNILNRKSSLKPKANSDGKPLRLRRLPMNFDFVQLNNLIIKLSYNSKGSHSQKSLSLTIFLNSKEAIQNEWSIYGPADNSFISLNLKSLGDTEYFSIEGLDYRIQFHETGETEFKTHKEVLSVDYFDFSITQMNP